MPLSVCVRMRACGENWGDRIVRGRMGDRNIDIVGVCMRACLYAWMDVSVCMCACVYEVLWGGKNDLVEGSVGETIGSARQVVSPQPHSEFSSTERSCAGWSPAMTSSATKSTASVMTLMATADRGS